jgi:polysaccharide pyruvyl transferase CsaB
MMVALSESLDPAEFELTALSGRPEETYRQYKIPSVPRRESRAVEDAIAKCDALVFPGGSIFQDATSVGSAYFYAGIVKRAKTAGKRVVMLSQGIGPLTTFFGKRFATGALNQCDAVAVRDPGAAQSLRDLGVKTKVFQTADLAFLLHHRLEDEGEDYKVGTQKIVGVAPRSLGKRFDSAGFFSELCKLLMQSGSIPVLIPMDTEEDVPLIDEISKKYGGKIQDMRKVQTPLQVMGRMARMDGIIAMRLHAAIFSTIVGVPPLMLSYDPKVAAFARMLEVGSAVPIDNLTAPRAFELYQSLQRDQDRNVRLLEKKRSELNQLSLKNLDVLRQTLGVVKA